MTITLDPLSPALLWTVGSLVYLLIAVVVGRIVYRKCRAASTFGCDDPGIWFGTILGTFLWPLALLILLVICWQPKD